ncbi:MAG: hypothetical protein WCG01_01830 [bacterium]
MKENFPVFNNERVNEQKLIDSFKAKGAKDPETQKLLIEWTIDQEKLAELTNDYALAQINLNLKRAHLYLAVGEIEAAKECLSDASIQAWNEYRDELYDKIVSEINDLS